MYLQFQVVLAVPMCLIDCSTYGTLVVPLKLSSPLLKVPFLKTVSHLRHGVAMADIVQM